MHAEQTIEASDVELCIARGRKRIQLSPKLEIAFQQHSRRYRERALSATITLNIIAYNLFLAIDYFVLPRTFWLSTAIHLGIVTPGILVSNLIIRRTVLSVVRETLIVGISFLMAAQILLIFALNEGVAADDYQYLATMVVVVMNVNQRPVFKYAVVASVALTTIYTGVMFARHSPLPVKLVGTSLMSCCAYLTLAANRQMGLDQRFAFLRRLQDGFRRDAAEAASRQDALTGLWNRRQLDLRMSEIWSTKREVDDSIAFLMIDVDHFKTFNDRYGHVAGDQCLKRVGAAIAAQLGDEFDLLVRYGGEEFLVMLVHSGIEAAVQTADRIRKTIEILAIPHESSANGFVSVSIGATAGPIAACAGADMIDGADTALYAAKQAGRNCVWPPFLARDIQRPGDPRLTAA